MEDHLINSSSRDVGIITKVGTGSFFTNKKPDKLKQRLLCIVIVKNHSKERCRVTESSLRVPLTISSSFTNLVPILRTMAGKHTYTICVFQIIDLIH